MLTVTLNLPQKTEQELEKDLKKLEILTEKSREFHIKEAVIRYLEHAGKMIKYYEQQKAKGSSDHTTKELLEHLNLKEIDWEK